MVSAEALLGNYYTSVRFLANNTMAMMPMQAYPALCEHGSIPFTQPTYIPRSGWAPLSYFTAQRALCRTLSAQREPITGMTWTSNGEHRGHLCAYIQCHGFRRVCANDGHVLHQSRGGRPVPHRAQHLLLVGHGDEAPAHGHGEPSRTRHLQSPADVGFGCHHPAHLLGTS
ncbi:hypothetical protein F5Y19DRAFT_433280 [Xylariaceae sp. FL1651]|nr:hypothetical protein F5Y19DRAFT_433280 [Xylariaceae sp. FL1651]